MLVIGPCSSDNEEAVLEYARRLADLQKKVADKIFMVMRVYTAKPRTNGDGYKGLVHQPDPSKAPSLLAPYYEGSGFKGAYSFTMYNPGREEVRGELVMTLTNQETKKEYNGYLL